VPRTGPQKSPLRPRCGLHPLDEGTATAYAAHYDTKAAIDYLKASGATAISVVAIDGVDGHALHAACAAATVYEIIKVGWGESRRVTT
jgi:hypothetical protein